MVKQDAACPSPPSKRIKKEPPSAEGIADEDVEELLIIAEGAEHGYDTPKKEPGVEASDVEAAMKSEDDNTVGKRKSVLAQKVFCTFCILNRPYKMAKMLAFHKSALLLQMLNRLFQTPRRSCFVSERQ